MKTTEEIRSAFPAWTPEWFKDAVSALRHHENVGWRHDRRGEFWYRFEEMDGDAALTLAADAIERCRQLSSATKESGPKLDGEEWHPSAADRHWYAPEDFAKIRQMRGTQTIERDKDAERTQQEEWQRQYEQVQAKRREEERRRTVDENADEALCDEDFLATLKGVVDFEDGPVTLDDIADL
jgi:hypothetical protein